MSILISVLSVLQQKKIKRLLAYSLISHVGFILIKFTLLRYYFKYLYMFKYYISKFR